MTQPATPPVRCAVYSRKSTTEGLEQSFNSLDAQRESCEAYIRSQQHDGWVCLPDCYDDGGFTGANIDRPAMKRLLADIEAGKIDCVVVYKVDRLSRSLLDFARLMHLFEEKRVSFVSVTQSFNSATSMGRLVLNVLLSFAQFEREIISERTRDKIAATRRKGKWGGGHAPLGYDADPATGKLVVNDDEAEIVRGVFDLYVRHESLLPAVRAIAAKGWLTKRWRTRGGAERGGQPFDRVSLHRMLTSPLYLGKVSHKGTLFPGEHAAIVPAEVWQRVQGLLRRNGRAGGGVVRNSFGALLKGLLRCGPCGCAMTPSHSKKGEGKRYFYYACTRAQRRGKEACPSRSVPAAQIERVVVEQMSALGRDPAMLRATLAATREADESRLRELDAERRVLEREAAKLHGEIRRVSLAAAGFGDGDPAFARLADLHDRARQADGRLRELRGQADEVRSRTLDEAEVGRALAEFMPMWEMLAPAEQARAARMLVERVVFDGSAGTVAITFHRTGLQSLTQRADGPKEKSA